MKTHTQRPAIIVCSSSTRTRETLDGLAVAAEWHEADPPRHYDRRLYLASGASILAIDVEAGADLPSVMVNGHNPGVHELALRLAPADTPSLRTMAEKFPNRNARDL